MLKCNNYLVLVIVFIISSVKLYADDAYTRLITAISTKSVSIECNIKLDFADESTMNFDNATMLLQDSLLKITSEKMSLYVSQKDLYIADNIAKELTILDKEYQNISFNNLDKSYSYISEKQGTKISHILESKDVKTFFKTIKFIFDKDKLIFIEAVSRDALLMSIQVSKLSYLQYQQAELFIWKPATASDKATWQINDLRGMTDQL